MGLWEWWFPLCIQFSDPSVCLPGENRKEEETLHHVEILLLFDLVFKEFSWTSHLSPSALSPLPLFWMMRSSVKFLLFFFPFLAIPPRTQRITATFYSASLQNETSIFFSSSSSSLLTLRQRVAAAAKTLWPSFERRQSPNSTGIFLPFPSLIDVTQCVHHPQCNNEGKWVGTEELNTFKVFGQYCRCYRSRSHKNSITRSKREGERGGKKRTNNRQLQVSLKRRD